MRSAPRAWDSGALHGARGNARCFGREARGSRRAMTANNNRIIIGLTFFVALVVGAIASLALGSWWFFALAVLVHAVASTVVVMTTIRLASQGEEPDRR